jgi:hypothetical protein
MIALKIMLNNVADTHNFEVAEIVNCFTWDSGKEAATTLLSKHVTVIDFSDYEIDPKADIREIRRENDKLKNEVYIDPNNCNSIFQNHFLVLDPVNCILKNNHWILKDGIDPVLKRFLLTSELKCYRCYPNLKMAFFHGLQYDINADRPIRVFMENVHLREMENTKSLQEFKHLFKEGMVFNFHNCSFPTTVDHL